LTSSTLEKEIARAVSINFEVKFILLTSSFYIIPNKNLNNRIKIIIPITTDIIVQIINKHHITNDLKLVKDFYDFLDNNNHRVNYPYYKLMRN